MKNDYFAIVYKILRTLRAKMQVEEFDNEQISHEVYGIGKEYWETIMGMLLAEGYVTGIKAVPILGRNVKSIKVINPCITEKGLVYLQENSLMQKAANIAKGIAEII